MATQSENNTPQSAAAAGTATGLDDAVDRALRMLAKSADGLGAFHMTACLRCGLCSDSCHIYLAEPQSANLPAAKASNVTGLFRRYHTFRGWWVPAS